jgi:hypothetical protein
MRAEIQDRGESASEAELRKLLDTVDAITEGARLIGDGIISCFFAEDKPRKRIAQLVEFQKLVLSHLGKPDWIDLAVPYARTLEKGDHPIRPFHWQLEFPEVFEGKNPGFDAIVGNPPFLGGKRISAELGPAYRDWVGQLFFGSSKNMDLVGHFYRKAFKSLKKDGVLGLIATNTIAQGATREAGLRMILRDGGEISNAQRRLAWPGDAAVIVSVVHIVKGGAKQPILDGKAVERISAYLMSGHYDDSPSPLRSNGGGSYIGSVVLGMGFTFDDTDADGVASSIADMDEIIQRNPESAKVVSPYIGGEEVNNHPEHRPHRYVINFGDCSETEARAKWPELLAVVEERVRPERKKVKRATYRNNWWRFAEPQARLYNSIRGKSHVLAIACGAAPHVAFGRIQTGVVFAHTQANVGHGSFYARAKLQGRTQEVWARLFASSMKDDLRYTPSDCFATFPFPRDFETETALEAAGETYHDHRAQLMIARNEGLTKTYNRFHDPNEKSPDIVRLRELHDAMDRAALSAYGWTDLAERIASDPEAMPRHMTEDTEDDHKYQGRYFWPAPIRDEVLARLLALNAERAEAERMAGLTPIASEDDGEGVDEDNDSDDQAA